MKEKNINVISLSSYYQFEIGLITKEIKQTVSFSPRRLNDLELKLFESGADVVRLKGNDSINSNFIYEKNFDVADISSGKPCRRLGYRLSNEVDESLRSAVPYHP